MKLSGNIVLITGGSAGIGLELAKQLTRRANKVIITGRDQAKLDKAQGLLPEIDAIRSDAASVSDMKTLFARVEREYPGLNILINNAGMMRDLNVHDYQGGLDGLTDEVECNLNGPIRMTQLFLPLLKKQPIAAVVNVTSGLAFVPLPISPIYCATKAGLHSYTQSLRVQMKKTKVKVFEVAPPATETELLRHGDPDDLKGVKVIGVQEMCAEALRGIEKDVPEIRVGQANALKLMSRLAPDFILKQLSKSADRMLEKA